MTELSPRQHYLAQQKRNYALRFKRQALKKLTPEERGMLVRMPVVPFLERGKGEQ